MTERKRGEVAQRLLDEASRELVTSFDCEATLQRVAELTVPTVADLCVITLQTEDSSLRPMAIADIPRRGPAACASSSSSTLLRRARS